MQGRRIFEPSKGNWSWFLTRKEKKRKSTPSSLQGYRSTSGLAFRCKPQFPIRVDPFRVLFPRSHIQYLFVGSIQVSVAAIVERGNWEKPIQPAMFRAGR
ncbi:uncharacterized protein AKAW2_41112A [Aspergillus luchuensis]|uniref:Uncharacterized protein n=1 Tax=Aspergillus kawachii TaxID=1069201 RepID=A0A7R7WB38_ASPKA|nr:uncharacterized protein AKAW2_41112A [Aspergillus luchuensis]BCR99429.1 hypothetical protein AKAW2_41112A [Aspergillus luchuensis]